LLYRTIERDTIIINFSQSYQAQEKRARSKQLQI
jgi:hypothetical protein